MTDFLYARPSFIHGMGSVLDLFGVAVDYNWSKDENEADARALFNDFLSVGKDLKDTMARYETELKSYQPGLFTQG